MTQNDLPAPWSNGTSTAPEDFDLEKAIDGAIAVEARRRRSGEIIETAHEECKQLLAAKFDELIRLSLPESLLNALKYEIRPDHTIWGCRCVLFYLDSEIWLSLPSNSLSDWRIQSDLAATEYCAVSHLNRTLLLYLERIRNGGGGIPFDELPDTEGEDDGASAGVYFSDWLKKKNEPEIKPWL